MTIYEPSAKRQWTRKSKIEHRKSVDQAAYILRENTGTSGLVESARAAVALLAEHDIPHWIGGGLAVQAEK